MITRPLRAREHRVVVMHHHGSRGFVTEQICIHSTGTGYHAIPRRAFAQRIHIVTFVLTRYDQRPVFFERAIVHQLGDVLARHAAASGVSLCHCFLTILIQGIRMPVIVFLQVCANMIEVHGLVGDLRTTTHLGFFNKNDGEAFAYHVAFCHGDLPHDAVEFSGDDMFHLHGLDHR